jgi:5,10-methylenetetrahydromethanopterin reductase
VVQYLPCAVDADRGAALRAAKRAVGEMLPGFWALAQTVPSARQALLSGDGLLEDAMRSAAERLRAGTDAAEVLDEPLAAAFSLFGTPDECLAQAEGYMALGVTELALTFSGPAAIDSIRALGAARALRKRSRAGTSEA